MLYFVPAATGPSIIMVSYLRPEYWVLIVRSRDVCGVGRSTTGPLISNSLQQPEVNATNALYRTCSSEGAENSADGHGAAYPRCRLHLFVNGKYLTLFESERFSERLRTVVEDLAKGSLATVRVTSAGLF
jgi:hypothetical protein